MGVLLHALTFRPTGKFVTVVGNVVRVSGISAMVLKASFACPKCGCEQTRQFVDGKFNPPTSCAGANCKARVSKCRQIPMGYLLRATFYTTKSERESSWYAWNGLAFCLGALEPQCSPPPASELIMFCPFSSVCSDAAIKYSLLSFSRQFLTQTTFTTHLPHSSLRHRPFRLAPRVLRASNSCETRRRRSTSRRSSCRRSRTIRRKRGESLAR